MYDEHVLALIEAVNGANVDAVHVFAPNAVFCDDVCHSSPLMDRRIGQRLVEKPDYPLPRFRELWG